MWWLKKIMGAKNSTYLAELSDESDCDSDFDYSLESRSNGRTSIVNHNSTPNLVGESIDVPTNSLATDYTNREMITTDASVKHFPKPELALCLDKVLEVEKSLDIYEMVSLVYLLYEDSNYALQELTLYLGGAEKNLLYTWANFEESRRNPWQKKLVEALCVIKNYQILRSLGYNKDDLNTHYLPHVSIGITNLNKIKKAVYLVCEKLNTSKTYTFLNIIKLHFQEKDLIFTEYDPEYLELYFLDWEIKGYISMTDMSNIKRTLKVMEDESIYNILETVLVAPQEKNDRKVSENSQMLKAQEKVAHRMPSTSTDTHQRISRSRLLSDFQSPPPSMGQDNNPNFNESLTDNNRYEIDPENPGLLLIINQEEFYTEVDDKFLDLLPADIEYNKLESRQGTKKDRIDLINTFNNFGFKVIIEDNLTHEELIAKVKEVVKSIKNESSLFICILSHGDKGVVYGANSCSVKVSKIQEIMCRTNKENLMGKPKILILQSCQGKQCQKLYEYSEDEYESYLVTTDGPSSSKQTVPQTVDMLTFWATVPGYAAIRNIKTGSWFIQALVKKMTDLGNKHHFADICTRIVNDVAGKTWTVHDAEKNAMTPMIVSTLRKDFYLPPMTNKKK